MDLIDAKRFTYQKDNNLLQYVWLENANVAAQLSITQMNILPLDPVLDNIQGKLGRSKFC